MQLGKIIVLPVIPAAAVAVMSAAPDLQKKASLLAIFSRGVSIGGARQAQIKTTTTDRITINDLSVILNKLKALIFNLWSSFPGSA